MEKRIGVLTSGGDAPGMNAAIRAVTRTAIYNDMQVVGICRGYEGLLEEDFVPLVVNSVGGILMSGGTRLRTARCEEFMREEGINAAVKILKRNDIQSLAVIGGDGSFRGANELAKRGVQVVGIPATIDNDMSGTDHTIGFDTACNTAVECIRKLRDTASSHDRMFIIEVMGRHAGFIALETGLACGAEYVVVPEIQFDLEIMKSRLERAKKRGKNHSLIIVAEGVMSASELAEKLKPDCPYEPRIVVLGHIQRGGAPTSFDTVLASTLGSAAVEAVVRGETGVMVGRINGKIVASPLETAWKQKHATDEKIFKLIDILSI
ncbi:MAG: 6-phosphofructokinase [Synergistes sp.]|nr:6-phosphofructokinase [Synergistes sp.]